MRSYSDPVRVPGSRKYYSRVRDPETLKRSYRATQTANLKDAKAVVARWRSEEAMGPEAVRLRAASEAIFAKEVATWLESKADKVRSFVYAAQSRYWIPYFGNKRVNEITADDVRDYLKRRRAGTIIPLKPPEKEGAKKRAEPKKKRKLAIGGRTLNEDRASLAAFFGWLIREGKLSRSPLGGIEKAKETPRDHKWDLTAAEEDALLRACSESVTADVAAARNVGGRRGGKSTATKKKFQQSFTPPSYLRPLVLTALRSGLRRRTLVSLTWQDIDLERGVWRIPKSKIKTGRAYEAPAAPSIVDALKGLRALRLEKEGVAAVAATAQIFPIADASSLTKVFKTACTRAGLANLAFHDMRRICLNSLCRRGVTIDRAIGVTQHSLAVALQVYRSVPAEDIAGAVRALDGLAPETKAAGQA